jgi:hypothetical protein
MRESRAPWFIFAVAIVAAMALIPFEVSRAHTAASPSAGAPTGPHGWTAFSPSDHAFQVVAPAGAQTSILNTSMGPAHQADFASGAYTVTWLDVPLGVTDTEALQRGKAGLLRPLIGRVADEEDDLTDNGHPGFGLIITVDGTTYDVRLFAASGRLFQVVGSAPAGSSSVQDAAAFVESFQLT